MTKRLTIMMLLLILSLVLVACNNDPENVDNDQKDQTDVDPIDDDSDNDDTPNTDDPDDTGDNNDTPPVTEGDHFAEGFKEARETYTHEVIIEVSGVYDIYSVATFDTSATLKTTDGETIKYAGRSGDFRMSVFLEPGTYMIEFRSFDRDDTGTYKLFLEFREDLDYAVYFVEDSVATGGTTEHVFTIETQGTYIILGTSDIPTQGTLRNKTTGNYLTTDFDSHPEIGFLIEYDFEPGTYEIEVRGYDWSASKYDIIIYLKTDDPS